MNGAIAEIVNPANVLPWSSSILSSLNVTLETVA